MEGDRSSSDLLREDISRFREKTGLGTRLYNALGRAGFQKKATTLQNGTIVWNGLDRNALEEVLSGQRKIFGVSKKSAEKALKFLKENP